MLTNDDEPLSLKVIDLASVTDKEDVMYFPMKVAIRRLGGLTETAQLLNTKLPTVNGWISVRRRRPPDDTLKRLSDLSGVSLKSLEMYYDRLAAYRGEQRSR